MLRRTFATEAEFTAYTISSTNLLSTENLQNGDLFGVEETRRLYTVIVTQVDGNTNYRFTALNENIEALTAAVGNQGTTLATHSTTLADHETRVTQNTGGLQTLVDRVIPIETRALSNETRLDALERRIAQLETREATVSTTVIEFIDPRTDTTTTSLTTSNVTPALRIHNGMHAPVKIFSVHDAETITTVIEAGDTDIIRHSSPGNTNVTANFLHTSVGGHATDRVSVELV